MRESKGPIAKLRGQMTSVTTAVVVAAGFVAQGLFALRTTLQWLASERAGRVRIPTGYWQISVAASILLLIYATATKDPVFIAGPLASLLIAARNLALQRPGRETGGMRRRLLLPIAALVTAALGAALATKMQELETNAPPLGWLMIGVLGQTLWLSRYLLQWYLSERLGRSTLPAPFWLAGLGGALLLFCYAIHQGNVVFILAYALNPIPYCRNLVLWARERRAT